MEKLKAKLQELKDLGFSKEQTTEILILGEEEILDKVLEDFASRAEPDLVNKYISDVKSASNEPQKLSALFTEIMSHLYGSENVEEKREELLIEYVQRVIDLTKETRNVYKKYSEGDPETVEAVEKAKQDPEIQDMAKKIQEEEEDQEDKG
jgi:flagellar hook-basal body complex protein FliE